MALGLDELIVGLQAAYNRLGSEFYDCGTELRNAGDSLIAGNFANAGYWLKEAGQQQWDASNHTYSMINGLVAWHSWLFGTIDFYWPEVEPLTATAICEAWAKNDFEDRALTIAFIDRMRQLIWDEPFFVAWAARPEESES